MSNEFDLGIVGMGPSGIGVAMSLKETSLLKKTICFERGLDVEKRICNIIAKGKCSRSNSCNIVFGIGGASNNSSGKLSLFPAGSGLLHFFTSEKELTSLMYDVISNLKKEMKLEKINILEDLKTSSLECYNKYNIQYKYYDVYEFEGNEFRAYISRIIGTLLSNGLQLKTETEVIEIDYCSSKSVYKVTVKEKNNFSTYYFKKIVVATGSIDINEISNSKIIRNNKAMFEIGVRAEGSTNIFKDFFDTHGDLKLKYEDGRTFCVTKNGNVISYSTNGLIFLEGSNSSRSKFSNLAVLIKCKDEKSINEFLDRYKVKNKASPIKQKYTDYMHTKTSLGNLPTTLSIANNGDISMLLPDEINKSLQVFFQRVFEKDERIDINNLVLIAPELKIVRSIVLSKHFEYMPNFFIVGSASGKFRGILQSLCSGLLCGRNILGS
jgi:uncharacterized FAD-dependent dehydrogenase